MDHLGIMEILKFKPIQAEGHKCNLVLLTWHDAVSHLQAFACTAPSAGLSLFWLKEIQFRHDLHQEIFPDNLPSPSWINGSSFMFSCN